MTKAHGGPWTVHSEHPDLEVNPEGHVRKRPNVTPDGRFVAKETWKVIQDFPMYEVTIGGDVRNAESHEVLAEVVGTAGNTYYVLWRDGKSYSRSWKNLVYPNFPELHEGWKTIPQYPLYQLSVDGEIRSKKRWTILPVSKSSTVKIRHNGERITVRVDELVAELYGKVFKA